ncbi:S-adenosyl-L-methionine-dependent methyltransferase [Hypoxylon sp. FL1284]|nr:S-adenosyl-L-methionine-dependent methyltransferase [Hypoxylon sp. FL1284]
MTAEHETTTASSGEPQSHPGDQHEIPSVEAHGSFDTLKERIKKHYEIASDYYYSLWGQHIHHGLFRNPGETKEQAQVNLINLLLDISALPAGAAVLDVGCGVGGTSRFLARERACRVTGVTISGRQVEMARQATAAEIRGLSSTASSAGATTATTASEPGAATQYPAGDDGKSGGGSARFLELDAEKMAEHFSRAEQKQTFDCVWISEALSHLPNKELFFASSFALTKSGGGGLLVVADWFKAPGLTAAQEQADIRPIEDGMLLPRLYTADEYVGIAERAGFRVRAAPVDISKDVAKTWDISWSLVSSPSLWAFAIAQGRDGLAFLQAFRAMRRGYANGTFRYAVMCFEKPWSCRVA